MRARRREIAYFSYSLSGAGGETTNQEDVFAVDPRTGRVRRLTDDRTEPVFTSDRDPAWSPDRGTLAIHRGSTADPTSRLCLISPVDGRTLRTLVAGHSPEWMGGLELLFLRDDDAWAVDLASLAVTRVTDLAPGARVQGLSWHPRAGLALGYEGGRRFSVAVVPPARVAAARAPGGTPVGSSELADVTGPGVPVAAPAWSPSGDRLALSTWTPGGPGRVGWLRVHGGSLRLLPPPPAGQTDFGAVFSPDGRRMAWVRGEEDTWSEIWLRSLRLRRSRRLIDDRRHRFKGSLDW